MIRKNLTVFGLFLFLICMPTVIFGAKLNLQISGHNEMVVGTSQQLTLQCENVDEETDAVVWSSSDEAVASVDGTTGEITALAPGGATITASLNGEVVTFDIGIIGTEKTVEEPEGATYLDDGSGLNTMASSLMGDTNADGHINSADALKNLQHSVSITNLSGESFLRGDVNWNNKIDSTDALAILQYSVKIIPGFSDPTHRGKIVSIAEKEEGYTEDASGSTKFGWWYENVMNAPGFHNGEWCAMFASWCANQAGISTNNILCHAYCPSGKQFFQARGRYKLRGYLPKPGDLIYFDWNANAVPDHVGIVRGTNNGVIYTVEGNTGSEPEKVRLKSYAYTYPYIDGFGIY